MKENVMLVKLLTETAKAPTRGSAEAAGLDLYCDITDMPTLYDGGDKGYYIRLYPGKRMLVRTNIAIDVAPSYYVRIAPRSSLAYKYGIDVLAGVIDSDYRGEVGVVLINLGDAPVDFYQHDRIAQLIPEQHARGMKVEVVDELSDTARGEGGFGSTGR